MEYSKANYRNILMITSIFGGVQVFQILTTLIKSKFISIFLGANGIGISGLFVSSLAIVNSLVPLGLNYSVTRIIAESSHNNDTIKLARVYAIFNRWIHFSSIIGMVIVICFSNKLSEYTFGNDKKGFSFILLSVTIIFSAHTIKNNTLLQGSRKIKELANSTILGSIFGLIISIPLYLLLGINSIVPTLIISSFCSFLVSQYYCNKLKIIKPSISLNETFFKNNDLLKLGLVMMFASFLGSIVIYIVNSYISYKGSIYDVGLYSAGISITSQFIGLIFSAMSLDYFPRLSSVSYDNRNVSRIVNQQSEITLLIMVPLLILMILTAPLLIKLLLTDEFQKLNYFVRIVAFGAIFQALSFTIGYIPLAKGDKNVYFIWNAIVINLLGVVNLIIGYKYWGLNGLAYALVVHHILSFIIFLFITRRKYNFIINKLLLLILVTSIFLVGSSLISIAIWPNIYGYCVVLLCFLISLIFTTIHVNKLVDIKSSFSLLIQKFK
jgi:O-antigen/teichoic acid export membrane protein